jgi:hypothetical protein
MASPPTPPLDSLKGRAFSFYPPILNVEHNEWRFVKATWSEILVTNARSGDAIWIPRRFLGEISRIDEPVVIVGLTRELEYKGGAVWPYQRRVIEMPVAVGAPPMPAPQGGRPSPVPVTGIRREASTDVRMFRLVGIVLAVAMLAYLIMANLFREGVVKPRVSYTTKDQSYLELRGHDDYYAVVAKLGQPARDRWRAETGEIQYRALDYPDRAYTVILMGTDRKGATYIGTVDSNWKPVHAVPFPRGGGNTFAMLRELRRF